MNRELLKAALSSTWAIQREAIPVILAQIRAELTATAPLQPQTSAYDRPEQMTGPVAIIRIVGGISHRASWWSGASCERIKAQLRAALNDDAVTAIVLDCDTPGGTVDGVPELGAEIFKARGRKPIVAVSNTLMCSAGLWLGSQADELIVSPSSMTGSLGVFALHEDISRMLDEMGVTLTFIFAGDHKVDGNPFEPLSDDARADLKAQVDAIHTDFIAAVARGRGVSPASIRKTYGQGKVYQAKDAVSLGIANRVATCDEVVMKLLGKKNASLMMRSAKLDAEVERTAATVTVLDPPALTAATQKDKGCECSADCPCTAQDPCPEDCPTCEDDCPCQMRYDDEDEGQAQAGAAQLAVDQAWAEVVTQQADRRLRRIGNV